MGGKPASNVVRTTISIPRQLKTRMDQAGEELNWSAIACAAFEAKLDEVGRKRRGTSQEGTLERLRASRRRADDADYQAGEAEGVSWVDRVAEVAELRRLEEWRAACGTDWDDVFAEGDDTRPYAAGELLHFAIRPDERGDRHAARTFWDELLRDGEQGVAPRPSFVRGFAEGALARWQALKDQL